MENLPTVSRGTCGMASNSPHAVFLESNPLSSLPAFPSLLQPLARENLPELWFHVEFILLFLGMMYSILSIVLGFLLITSARAQSSSEVAAIAAQMPTCAVCGPCSRSSKRETETLLL